MASRPSSIDDVVGEDRLRINIRQMTGLTTSDLPLNPRYLAMEFLAEFERCVIYAFLRASGV